MNIEELWKILDKEKKPGVPLQVLEADFYQRATEYIRELEKERTNTDDAQKVRIIDDELKSARRIVEEIFDLRVRKIQEEARSRAKGHRSEMSGLTEYEAEIFDGVQKTIEAGRRKILGTIVSQPQTDRRPEKTEAAQQRGMAGPEAAPGSRTAPGPPEKGEPRKAMPQKSEMPPPEFLIVRTMRDIPVFAGTDGRTYGVASGEVIMLPRANVEALCKRGAAAVVNVKTGEGSAGTSSVVRQVD